MTVSLKEFADEKSAPEPSKLLVGKVAELIESSGLDVNEIGSLARVNLWQGLTKDADGIAQVQDLVGIQINPKFESGPEWPVVQQAKPLTVRHAQSAPQKAPEGFKRAMTLPDMQIGFYADSEGSLHTTHDEAALDVALQLVKFVRPDKIVMHGDNIDFPEASRFRLTSAFAQTTQASIDRASLFGAQLRAAAGPDCEIIWLEGNHEARLSYYIIDNAKAAFGLTRANTPKEWPVLSVPFLCRLDDFNIEYRAGYPANEAWINDRLRVIHGHLVASNGSTSHKYLANERVSVIFGHVHRREWAERTRSTREGPRTILAMSPGCLCRTDGGVPSTKGGVDLFGVPIKSVEDWQQGVAVFTYEDGEGRFIPEQVPIMDGWTIYRGKSFQASVDVEGNAL